MNCRRTPQLAWNFGGLVVDNFAGGGGASTGIEAAQVAKCGNSVPPPVVTALVQANMAAELEYRTGERAKG